MAWTPYKGSKYLDFPAVEAWCHELVKAHSDWFQIEEIGTSRHGRSIELITVGDRSGTPDARPAFWLDGGTHASEWTGVMAVLHTLSNWAERLQLGDEETTARFKRRTAYVVPCISPDGFQALCEGHPFLRSSLRPPPAGSHPVGLRPADVSGDGTIRWMRWKHPAGSWVCDPESPMWMRHRTFDDDPADAFCFCSEGTFVHWDGSRWSDAPREFGLDLNRNFPGSWTPFRMFGMDGGSFPLSEPESRAVVDAVAARPNIATALTNHTYTGCILTQPYRDPSPLSTPDIDLFESLALKAVDGTGYRVIKTHPDFMYDPKVDIVGVWSDTLSTTFGLPGYTLELWDPYGFAGVEIEKPAAFFRKPDPAIIKTLIEAFATNPDAVSPWVAVDHPQLGPVEIGGIDYMRTVRNPPEALLPAEVAKGALIADRLLQATPDLHVEVSVTRDGELTTVEAVLVNHGFLPTAASAYAEAQDMVPPIRVVFDADEGIDLIAGEPIEVAGHLDGWGSMQVGAARHAVYPGLGGRGPRPRLRWIVRGGGTVRLKWTAPRAGSGQCEVTV